MTQRYLGSFQRFRAPLGDEDIRASLEALDDLGMGFLPARMWTSSDKAISFAGPREYRRQLIPEAYYVEPGVATIPLEASNGIELTFTESANLATMPASLAMDVPATLLGAGTWNLHGLIRIFRAVVGSFAPDRGFLADEAHVMRPEYQSRKLVFDSRKVPEGLYWINYFGPEWVSNVGAARLDRLRGEAATFERLESGGVLVAIQDTPYDESATSDRVRQERFESLIDLGELQGRFPNPGL